MQSTYFWARRFSLGGLLMLLTLALAFPSAAQQEGQNLCRGGIAQTISVGETMAGTISSDIPSNFYCFDGERGDNVTITVEVTDGSLAPGVIITEPVYTEENMSNPLGVGEANRSGGTAEVNFELDSSGTYLIVVFSLDNSAGSFEITLDAEARSIFNTSTEEPDSNGGDDGNNPSNTEIVPGETNLCRIEGTEYIAYGDSITGELDETQPVMWYCFEGTAGDVVNIEVGTKSGDIVMLAVVAQPFFDFTPNTIYTGDQANNRNDSADFEFIVPDDGDYIVFVQVMDGQSGEFYLDITGEAGIIHDCTNEPLNLLSANQWMVAPTEEGTEPLVKVNVACDGQMTISTFDAAQVGQYHVDQDGIMSFSYGNQIFTTASVDETAWTFSDSSGTEYQLVPVPDTNCSDEFSQSLFNARWEFGSGDSAYFTFMCNGLLILNYQDQSFAQSYSYADGVITMDLGEGQILEFTNVSIEGNEMAATYDDNAVTLENVLNN